MFACVLCTRYCINFFAFPYWRSLLFSSRNGNGRQIFVQNYIYLWSFSVSCRWQLYIHPDTICKWYGTLVCVGLSQKIRNSVSASAVPWDTKPFTRKASALHIFMELYFNILTLRVIYISCIFCCVSPWSHLSRDSEQDVYTTCQLFFPITSGVLPWSSCSYNGRTLKKKNYIYIITISR